MGRNDHEEVLRYKPKGGLPSTPDILTIEIFTALEGTGAGLGAYIEGNGSVHGLLQEWNKNLEHLNPSLGVELSQETGEIVVYQRARQERVPRARQPYGI